MRLAFFRQSRNLTGTVANAEVGSYSAFSPLPYLTTKNADKIVQK